MFHSSFLQASYTEQGDIVLHHSKGITTSHDSSSSAEIVNAELSVLASPTQKKQRNVQWTSSDVDRRMPSISALLQIVSDRLRSFLRLCIRESRIQYLFTRRRFGEEVHSLKASLQQAPVALADAHSFLLHHADTPIPVPRQIHKALHPRTSIGRFLLDSVRFGCTFAFIFGIFFTALNYHSFWQIMKAEFALGNTMQQEQALTQVVQGTFGIEDGAQSSSGFSDESVPGLLSALPAVGPREDRLIIPKIGKNVAIVRPSMDALIHENWKQFEEDIQHALRDGVVHYPGSARPGQAGNFFVTGHSSYYPWDPGKYKDVFARLHELSIGDRYFVYYGGEKHVYRVISKKEVQPTDVSVLDQPMDKRLSTLMTCTPVGTTLRRLIIIAEEIDPNTEEVLQVGEHTTDEMQQRLKNLEALPM